MAARHRHGKGGRGRCPLPNSHCLYNINSATQLFAGLLGNLELSSTAVDLSVVSSFSASSALLSPSKHRTMPRFACFASPSVSSSSTRRSNHCSPTPSRAEKGRPQTIPSFRYLYSINSATQLFAGRLSNLELSSSVADLSVVSSNSFAFLLGVPRYTWGHYSVQVSGL